MERQRSLVAGTLPGLLSDNLGIVDALLVGALISHVVMGFGISLGSNGRSPGGFGGGDAGLRRGAIGSPQSDRHLLPGDSRGLRAVRRCGHWHSMRTLPAVLSRPSSRVWCCSSMFAVSSGRSPRSDSPLSLRSWSEAGGGAWWRSH